MSNVIFNLVYLLENNILSKRRQVLFLCSTKVRRWSMVSPRYLTNRDEGISTSAYIKLEYIITKNIIFYSYFDKNETSLSTRWISSSVEPLCFVTPLIEHFICSECGSGISFLCTKTDPKGQNVSILLAIELIKDLKFDIY